MTNFRSGVKVPVSLARPGKSRTWPTAVPFRESAESPAMPIPPAPRSVFVYGTLRRGEKNHRRYLAGRYRSCTPATLRGRLFFDPREGYPYLVPAPGIVHGEVFELDPATAAATLRQLDGLEDYDPGNETGSLYLRREADALLADGRTVRVWVYFWNGPEIGQPVAGGDFSALRKGRS